MKSAIYEGILQHCRYKPKHHFFQYKVFMVYLDLDELESVFGLSKLWSYKKMALAWLKRSDFIGDSNQSIAISVKDRIKKETGNDFKGSIRMLANLRYFGFQMNPIVCYYCFNTNEQLEYVVAEVTNTPWREKHAYVLTCDLNQKVQAIKFDKKLHVSPFNNLDFVYEWLGSAPDQALSIRLINWKDNKRLFDANLELQRQEISSAVLTKIILLYPFMTVKIFLSIYWQALLLFIKRVPFISHPKNSSVRILTEENTQKSH